MTDFTFHSPATTSPEGAEILKGIEASYGFIPNLFAYMAESPNTVAAYRQLNKLLEQNTLTAAQNQVALLAISKENGCSFCTVAHRAIGKASGARAQTLEAINSGAEIADESDRALAQFARLMVQKSGYLSDEDLQAFFAAGFSRAQVFEVILINTIKTLSNYSNHLTQPQTNPELLAML